MNFDVNGRLDSIFDVFNNVATLNYPANSSDSLVVMFDPTGHKFVFSYASGAITIIDTMPGQASARRSVVGLNGSNQITYDSMASPTSRPAKATFTYSSVGSNNATS